MEREMILEKNAFNLESAMNEVKDRHKQLVIVDEGRRVMAMIPIDLYDRWFAERERAFEYFDHLRTRTVQYSDEEVEADIERAINEVRAKDLAK
jgi:PHD/YefM family antitoxin component YafN of YafNO toxin-antitoxin module